VVVTAWALLFCRRTLGVLGASVYSFFVGSYLITPRMFNYGKTSLSYTGYYNLLGYGLLFLVLAGCMSGSQRASLSRSQCVSLGALIVILLLLKFPYGIAATCLVGLHVSQLVREPNRLADLACGLAIAGLPFLAYYSFDLSPMVRDIQIVAQVGQHRGSLTLTRFVSVLASCWKDVLYIVCAAGLLIGHHWRSTNSDRIRLSVLGVSVIVLGVFLSMSITQEPPEFALAPAFCLLAFLVVTREQWASRGVRQITLSVACGVVAMLSAGPPLYTNIWPFFELARTADFGRTPFADRFITAPLADVASSQYYRDIVNDGLAVLESMTTPQDRVMCIDWTNPFSFGLGLPGAKNDLIYWQYGVTFDELVGRKFDSFEPRNVFADATVLMIPAVPIWTGTVTTFNALYGEYLQNNFRLATRTEHWHVYRRI